MRTLCLVLVFGLVACDVEVEPFCGDGHIDLGEQCDDGGSISGDGCSSVCAVEGRCGDARVDLGEQCDDANTIAGDGCSSTCKTEACGNSAVDAGEQCDDGDLTSGDGCSATCTIEQKYTISATWVIRPVVGDPVACPTGYDTAALIAQPIDAAGNPAGNAIVDLFNCSAGTGTNLPIYQGRYDVWISIQNAAATSVYATSVKARIDLQQNTALTADIYTNGGYFAFAWVLRGAVTNNALTCAQANAASADLTATLDGTMTAYTDIFDCTDGQGITAVIPAGTYTVSIAALDAGNQSVGTAPELTSRVIQGPNKITDLGTVTIPITGL